MRARCRRHRDRAAWRWQQWCRLRAAGFFSWENQCNSTRAAGCVSKEKIMAVEPVAFPNAAGQMLAGRLEMPAYGVPRAWAVYAHCFTCGKDVRAAVDICRALCVRGIAVLRFDFTGLGQSAGEFADTTPSSNISDLVQAAKFLEQHYQAPKILVGHSLGGTAVLEAAHLIPSCIAVATVAAPANPEHVANLLGTARQVIEPRGEADVMLAGRKLHFKKAFLDDLKN